MQLATTPAPPLKEHQQCGWLESPDGSPTLRLRSSSMLHRHVSPISGPTDVRLRQGSSARGLSSPALRRASALTFFALSLCCRHPAITAMSKSGDDSQQRSPAPQEGGEASCHASSRRRGPFLLLQHKRSLGSQQEEGLQRLKRLVDGAQHPLLAFLPTSASCSW